MSWRARAAEAFDRFDVVAPVEVSDTKEIRTALEAAVPGGRVEVYHTYKHVHARVDLGGDLWQRSKEVRSG